MKLSEVNVKDIKKFEDLYLWVCSMPIEAKDRRILMDLIDVSCKLNTKLWQSKGAFRY